MLSWPLLLDWFPKAKACSPFDLAPEAMETEFTEYACALSPNAIAFTPSVNVSFPKAIDRFFLALESLPKAKESSPNPVAFCPITIAYCCFATASFPMTTALSKANLL